MGATVPIVPLRQDGAATVIVRPAMPNDLSIQAAAPVNTGRGPAMPIMPAATVASVEQIAPSAMPSSSPTPASPNPTLTLNAALGLVVIEFRNAAGSVTSQIPTVQQIQAYQLWQVSGIGPAPSLGASGDDGAPPAAAAQAAAPAPTPAASSGAGRPGR
jgi:hypothetical protein